MRLVEVVTTVLTDPAVADDVVGLATRCGKTPVAVGDRAGFIANALLLPYLNHAAASVETGRVTPAAVDDAIVALAGLPMGPLALMDLIGLDVCLAILDVLWDAATPLLRRLVMAGRLGRKAGGGWYAGPSAAEASGTTTTFDPGDLLAAHVADGRRMVDDGYADEQAIDTAMRLGCGYPEGLFALGAAVGR
jgi:3-hydroxybutyryl-CoA dehydrogenase